MKLLFWRRKPKQDALTDTRPPNDGATTSVPAVEVATREPRPPVQTVDRSQIPTRPLAMPLEVRDTVLRFAQDTLVTSGAKVRIEAEDQIVAMLPDGSTTRYTTTLARAREDEETRLLVQGGAALAELVDRCAEAASFGALALPERVEPVGAARLALAAPRTGCERCTVRASGGLDACAQCPLHEGRIVLRGLGRLDRGRLMRAWGEWSVELAYEVAYDDRQGRRSEWVRLAFTTSSLEPRAILDPDALRIARSATVPAELAAAAGDIAERAERALGPQLEAGAAFLRLRSQRDFRDRLADLQSTATRLARETPADADQIRASLTAEIERLSEVFAVDVEARLESVCFVSSPMAEVRFERARGSGVTVVVDLGRDEVHPPACASCGRPARSGRVCEQGHATCAECAGKAAEHCAGCVASGDRSATAGTSRRKRQARTSSSGDRALTLAGLHEMSPETWRDFAGWLVEQDGVTLERSAEHGGMVLCHGRDPGDGATVIAAALRPRQPLLLSEEDVRRAVAASAAITNARLRLLSTAIASDEATSEARRLGVELTDGDALARRLEALEATQISARSAEREATGSLATVAAQTREALLVELAALEETLSRAATGRRAAGRAAVVTAAEVVGAARQEALRAFLAWDTLTGEWQASFDERGGREGALIILADAARFAEMAERAAHLRVATVSALERIASTPSAGDLGYGAWRRTVAEEMTARCESCRWRLLALDPAEWEDFTAAHDTAALERATSAEVSAGHAAARAAKAYSDMAERARL